MSSDRSASHRDVKEALEQFRRDCWIPKVAGGEGGVAGSRFGGRPALRAGEEWPTCGACEEKLPLFVQIDLAASPGSEATPEPLRSGILQLLYCSNEMCDATGDWVLAAKTVARIIPVGEIGRLRVGEGGRTFPAKQIVEWIMKADFPHYEEAIDCGVSTPEDELSDYYDQEFERGNPIPIQSDKLDGWPDWVQSMFYPSCSVCKQKMIYVFQMASNDNVPYMFGDCGIGHVFVCPCRPESASFLWDCC